MYELPLCTILYQYINKYGYYEYFPISRDFHAEFWLFYPKNSHFWPFQIAIIACIVSLIMNYKYAKLHVFIKKLTIDAIIRWL